jgi:hypothetical protein
MSGLGQVPFGSTLLYSQPSLALRRVIQFSDPNIQEYAVQTTWFFGVAPPIVFPVFPGLYSLGGQPAGFILGRSLEASPNSYILGGQPANLSLGRYLEASPNSYILTGRSARLIYSRFGYWSFVDTSQNAAWTLTQTSS